MTHWFTVILIQPLINLLAFGYHYIPDIGVVIILLTILIRVLLAPSFHKSLSSQRQMAAMQPKLNAVREKYKEDKVAQSKAMMDLYKEHQVSPFSSCLPLIIQLPILIALYQVFYIGLGNQDIAKYLYHFVPNPGVMSPYFLHWINLAKPSFAFGVVAAIAQYFQSRLMLPPAGQTVDSTQKMLQYQTLYFLPILTMLFSLRLPAGLPLYWVVTTLFAIGQQYYIIRKNKPLIGQVTVVK
ncbi:MAG: YidC/Oxa1 family membrane protein insertase [Sphingobacteriales bacterium]